MNDALKRPRLVVDVGGSNVRWALVDPQGRLFRVQSMACGEYPTLEAALRDYLEPLEDAMRPRQAALAVASPVLGDRVQLTNHEWSFSTQELRESLDFTRLEVLNDFYALALALPLLENSDCAPLKPGDAEPGSPLALIGPGTGLGVAALIPDEGRWLAVSTEAGHRDLAPVTDREVEIFSVLRRRFGHVSAERVLSGPGLVNLYAAICELEGTVPGLPSPAQVVERARRGTGSAATEAVGRFSAWLGAVAGDLALSFGARGGVYLGGGILPRMGETFDRDAFCDRFAKKGRFRGYVEAIPVQIISTPTATLKGVARALEISA